MLSPLFFSVRLPTLLALIWRSLCSPTRPAGLPHHGAASIIIFRLDAMGDVVMTTPLFRELKRAFPKARSTLIVQNTYRPLLATSPHIDEILCPPTITASCLPRSARELLAAWLLYWRHLRTRRFDIAISPRWDTDEHHATLLCLLSNPRLRVGYTEKASALKRRVNRGFDAAFDVCLPAGPVRHEVVRNLRTLEALGATVEDSRLEIHLSERDRAAASRRLTMVPPATKVIALGIGAAGAGRRWPVEGYAECGLRLAQQMRVQFVIVCSAGERDSAQRLEKLLSHDCILLCGVPLREVCAVLEHCDLFIGNDSGPAHLAAAMDCRTIVIPRHPRSGDPNHANSPLRFGPYCRFARVLQPAIGLDGCTTSCELTEPHCITAVSVDDVVAAARAMLDREPSRYLAKSVKTLIRREAPLGMMKPVPGNASSDRPAEGRP